MSRLTARVIAHFNMTLVELHSNMIIVSIVQQDSVILCCRHLQINIEIQFKVHSISM